MNAQAIISRAMTILVCTGSALCVIFAAQVAWWAADRDAPFVLLDYKVAPAKAGQNTVVEAIVKRDMSRRCSLLFSRSFFDSKGIRYELTDGAQFMNSATLTAVNQRGPGILKFNVKIPLDAAPGVGSVMTTLDYQCNPLHQIYPISMVVSEDIEVLP